MTITDEKKAKKNKRDWIIASVLLVIFAFSFTENVLLRKKKLSGETGPSNEGGTQTLTEQMVLVTNVRLYDKLRGERVALWDREWGRDPFMPQQAVGAVVKAVNLSLGGILWDEKTPKAIVNEKILIKGDTLYGYTVVEIKPRSVILKTGEKNIELYVFRPVLVEASIVNS